MRRGFSLIELMFALAIVSFLAAIAIPSYRGYIDKTNVNKSIAQIYAMQTCMERFFTDNNTYPVALTDVASCLPDQGIDPWGNAYVYLNIANGGPGIKGQVRKDHALNPINQNYDLYSMGKDGVTKKQTSQKDSLDDVILARDGAFVGLAADF